MLIFLLFFIWVRYYEHNLNLCLAYTSILTFVADCFLSVFLQKRDVKNNLKKQEIADAEEFANSFVFNGNAFANNFWNSLISQKHKTSKKTYYFTFFQDDCKTAFYPCYSLEKISPNDVLNIFNKLKKENIQKLIICGNAIDPQTKNFASKLPCKVLILDKFESYEKLMKKFDTFPKKTKQPQLQKQSKWQNFLAYSLNKNRAKGYIISSLILIFSSFFVRISVYYLIISSVLLFLAIFSFTNTFYNKKLPDEII